MRLYKRGDTWWCIFYENGERQRVSTHCHDKKAAEEIARALERDAANPAQSAANKTSLSDVLQLLLKDREEQARAGRRSADTVEFYRRKSGHLVRVFETTDDGKYVPFLVRDLKAFHVDDFISRRRREGAQDSTIAKELVTLRAALKIAKRRELWFGDVSAICPVAFSPNYKPRTRALLPEELTRLLEELSDDKAARVAFMLPSVEQRPAGPHRRVRAGRHRAVQPQRFAPHLCHLAEDEGGFPRPHRPGDGPRGHPHGREGLRTLVSSGTCDAPARGDAPASL